MATVLLFARAREIAGGREVTLDAPTIAEALEALATAHGEEMAALLGTCTIVVDGEAVSRSQFSTHPIGDELAVLPPVSGGCG